MATAPQFKALNEERKLAGGCRTRVAWPLRLNPEPRWQVGAEQVRGGGGGRHGSLAPRVRRAPPHLLRSSGLSHTLYLLIAFRKSTPPQNRQLNILISNSKQ